MRAMRRFLRRPAMATTHTVDGAAGEGNLAVVDTVAVTVI